MIKKGDIIELLNLRKYDDQYGLSIGSRYIVVSDGECGMSYKYIIVLVPTTQYPKAEQMLIEGQYVLYKKKNEKSDGGISIS